MAVPIPFPYIRSLPKADQQRLKRDFDAVLDQITSTKVYDAYVNSEATADNPGTLTFTTPYAAIKYVRETLGRVWVNIGWVKPTSGNPVTATETGNYGGTNTCFVTIDVIGADDAGDLVIGGSNHNAAQWDTQGFTDSSKFVRVRLRGIAHSSSLSAGQTPFQNASCEMAAENCYFNYGSHAAIASSGQQCFFRSCSFVGATYTGTAVNYFDGCWFNNIGGATPTITQGWVTSNCHFSNLGSATFTGTIYVFAESHWTQYSSGSAQTSGTLNFNSTSTTRVYITTGGEESPVVDQAVTINISAAIQYVWLEGNFWSVTVAAPPPATGAASAALHHIAVHCERFFDITGPAVLSSSAQFGANFLRGEGLSGSVLCGGNLSSGVGLSFVGVHDSTIMAAFQAYSTAGTGIAYSIDSASSNNVIIIEGHALFTSPSTNGSTTTIVVRHDSTFPINGRDSTGDALNKDMLPAWMGGEPLPGVTTIPAPAPGSAPTGPATGSLAGTYPAPTFAGRDASVDKINQDILPAALVDPNGVTTIPAPAAVAAVDLRDFQHEWIAELSTGVQTIPPATSGSAPTGPAGASLAGTYPNPTFAGRDASVDELNKDMLPTLLGPQEGVTSPQGSLAGFLMPVASPGLGQVLVIDNLITQRWLWRSILLNPSTASGSLAGSLPGPTFAGRDASVDEINKDLLPSLLTPGDNGVLMIPQPVPKEANELWNPGTLASTLPDLAVATAATVFPAANQFFMRVPVPRPFTSVSVIYEIATAGVTLVNAFVAWYDSSGNMIVQSANQAAIWNSTGLKTTALAVTPVWTGPDTFGWLMFFTGTAATAAAFRSTGTQISTLTNAGSGTSNRRVGSKALASTATMPNVSPSTMTVNTPIIAAALI